MIKHRFLVRIIADLYVWYHGSHPIINKCIHGIPKVISVICVATIFEVFAIEFGIALMAYFDKIPRCLPSLPYFILGNLLVASFAGIVLAMVFVCCHFNSIVEKSTRRCRVNIRDAILQKKLRE